MLEFQRGSREAFDELFARYRYSLYGYFRRRLADRERAEDLTQETFLAVIRATERYQPREPVRADRSDQTLWVREALERLDPVEREILMLREYEQLSYAEIAGLLGLPLNTVRTRLFRSRMALKSRLEPANHEA
jgi:RNA polymerase sigma-70 factor (ECF subfamily)